MMLTCLQVCPFGIGCHEAFHSRTSELKRTRGRQYDSGLIHSIPKTETGREEEKKARCLNILLLLSAVLEGKIFWDRSTVTDINGFHN